MKASVTPTATRSSTLDRRESLISQVLERSEPAGDQEVGDHDQDRDGGEGGRERQVVGDVVEDDIADELIVRDQGRRDVVAHRQREREDRAGDDGGEGERQEYPADGP